MAKRERFPAECPVFRMARDWGGFKLLRRCPRQGQIVMANDIADEGDGLFVFNLDARKPQTEAFGDEVGWACVPDDLIPLTRAAREMLAIAKEQARGE